VTHQLLVCTNIAKNMNTICENTEALSDVS